MNGRRSGGGGSGEGSRRGGGGNDGEGSRRGGSRRQVQRRSEYSPSEYRGEPPFLLEVWWNYADTYEMIIPHPFGLILFIEDFLPPGIDWLFKLPVYLTLFPLFYIGLIAFAVIGLPISFIFTLFSRFCCR